MERDLEALEDVEAGRADTIARCYGWSLQAVTIGRLQNADSVKAEFGNLPIYRRPTGGRAVIHGDDLTISVAARHGIGLNPARIDGSLIKRGVLADYFNVTEAIRSTLHAQGILTDYGQDAVRYTYRKSIGQSGAIAGHDVPSEDCFKTNAKCDIVTVSDGVKICGCAMKRHRNAFLVQASLLRLPEVDIFGAEFQSELQCQLARYLTVERWDFPAGRD